MKDMIKLGEDIRRYRTETIQMTQEELARKVGVEVQTVSAWENGNREPRLWHFFILSRIFHVKMDEFLGIELENKTNFLN